MPDENDANDLAENNDVAADTPCSLECGVDKDTLRTEAWWLHSPPSTIPYPMARGYINIFNNNGITSPSRLVVDRQIFNAAFDAKAYLDYHASCIVIVVQTTDQVWSEYIYQSRFSPLLPRILLAPVEVLPQSEQIDWEWETSAFNPGRKYRPDMEESGQEEGEVSYGCSGGEWGGSEEGWADDEMDKMGSVDNVADRIDLSSDTNSYDDEVMVFTPPETKSQRLPSPPASDHEHPFVYHLYCTYPEEHVETLSDNVVSTSRLQVDVDDVRMERTNRSRGYKRTAA